MAKGTVLALPTSLTNEDNCMYAPGDWIGEETWLAVDTQCGVCTVNNVQWNIEDFSSDGTQLAIKRLPYEKSQCTCSGPCSCYGYEVVWFGSCSGGQINASGNRKLMNNGNRTTKNGIVFIRTTIDGNSTIKTELSDLTGFVSADKMMLKWGDTSDDLKKA